MLSLDDFLIMTRSHPMGSGTQKLWVFPNGFGVVASCINPVEEERDNTWTLEIVKYVNVHRLAWAKATEEDKLGIPLKVSLKSTDMEKALVSFMNWCIDNPAAKAPELLPVVGDGVPDQPIPGVILPVAGNEEGAAAEATRSTTQASTKAAPSIQPIQDKGKRK